MYRGGIIITGSIIIRDIMTQSSSYHQRGIITRVIIKKGGVDHQGGLINSSIFATLAKSPSRMCSYNQ